MSPEALWVDANVLLHFLTGEPPEMADRAQRFFERAEAGELRLRVEGVAVAETVWVLRSFYGRSADEISGALIPLLERPALRVEEVRSGVMVRALEVMAQKNVDFADALLAETARAHGEGVASFNSDFRGLGVEWREPG